MLFIIIIQKGGDVLNWSLLKLLRQNILYLLI